VTILTIASQAVLILTAMVLFYVALTDLRYFKIHNEFILVLIGLFSLHAFLSGRWTTLHWNLGFAALMFLIMFYFYSLKMMGGGDLKLLTAAFLWVGPFFAMPFALLLLGFVCVHILAIKLKFVEAHVASDKKWLPFAPSISAALISIFMAGYLQSV